MASSDRRTARSTVGIILAAGKGTRMKSQRPKVLFHAAGRSLLDWVRYSLSAAGVQDHCVALSEDLAGFDEVLAADVTIGLQINRLGTGDAVAAMAGCFAEVETPAYAAGKHYAGPVLDADSVIICAGDVPGVRPESYRAFLDACQAADASLGVLGMKVADPTGYGRLVINKDGSLDEIVEEKDATDEIRRIDACNTGIIYAKTKLLFQWLSRLNNNNASGEYYLTDCIGIARDDGHKVYVHLMDDEREFLGVNNRTQLADAEQTVMSRKRHDLMLSGVTLRLPETILVEADVSVGVDSTIAASVALCGKTTIGANCEIGHGSCLQDVHVAENVVIGPGCVLRKCEVNESVPAGTVREG